jgi:hypothetical protein
VADGRRWYEALPELRGRLAAAVSLSRLHQAIQARECDRTLEIAARQRHVPLRYAARITRLLAEERHPRYKAAADAFLVRVIEEVHPPMLETKKLADALAHVHHVLYAFEALTALQNVVGQLHRMHKISVEFDSEQMGRVRSSSR